MKKMIGRISILVMLVAVVSACSQKKTEYTHVIPVDATSVVVLDFKSMGDKAGLNDAENEQVRLKVIDALKSGLNAQALTHVEKILKDPKESGIDFNSPTYIFVSPAFGYPVMVAKVTDEKKLRTTLDIMASEQISDVVTEVDGYSYTMAGGNLVAYSNSAIIITQTSGGSQQDVIARLLRGDADNNVHQNEYFKEMQKRSGDILFFGSMKNMPRNFMRQFGMTMPMDFNPGDMTIAGNINFDKGKISSQLEMLTENQQLKDMMEKQKKAMGKINGNLLSDFPQSTLAFLTLNVNGEELYNMLRENEDFRQNFSVEQAAQMRDLFNSFKGDISMALLNVTMNSMPTFVAYAETDKEAAINTIYENREKLFGRQARNMMKLAPNEYVMRDGRMNMFFGLKNKHIYLTNDELIYKGIGLNTDKSMKDARYASAIKGKSHYLAIDLEAISQLPLVKMMVGFNKQAATAYDVVSRFSYLEVAGDNNKNEINLYMRDKDTNSLKQIVDVAKQYVGF